jgi:hypothetical protein
LHSLSLTEVNGTSDEVNDTGLDDDTVFTGERNFTVKEIQVFALPESIGLISLLADSVRLSGSAKSTAADCAIAFGGDVDVRMRVGSFGVHVSRVMQRYGRRIRRVFRSTQ